MDPKTDPFARGVYIEDENILNFSKPKNSHYFGLFFFLPVSKLNFGRIERKATF